MSQRVTGVMKWFDLNAGFGFMVADDGGGDIFLHSCVLRACGFADPLPEPGAVLDVDWSATARGRKALTIFSVNGESPAPKKAYLDRYTVYQCVSHLEEAGMAEAAALLRAFGLPREAEEPSVGFGATPKFLSRNRA